MKVKFSIVLLCLILLAGFSHAQNFNTVQNLINRQFPTMKTKVVFKKINFDHYDSANYSCTKNKLSIYANTINAATYALYDYVKKYCNSSLSHTGNHVNIPAILPNTKGNENVTAVYPLRYALNYCTYNYTMSFWKWEDWEKELDWMALNGVNLLLTQMGTEEVWQKTLTEFGFSDKDIRAFIPGPAFNAWWLMGNLQGWGGPVSDNMIQHWTALQKKILVRMKELGIQPVIQGFTGIVPSSLSSYFPSAKLIDQGNWCGFKRPPVLSANDPLFDKMATSYYKNFKDLYGKDFKYLGGDLFHEGGNTTGVNLTETATKVQKKMIAEFPNAVWVLQGWQSNPKQQILDGLDPKNTLIIDLLGDNQETWNKRNQYGGFPWIWTTITNFGGKTTSSGNIRRVYEETKKAEQIFGKNLLLKGTGIIPEGIENNAIVYQWALDKSWQKNEPDFNKNLDAFILARYGTINKDLKDAWQYLAQTIYSNYKPSAPGGQGGYESIFCARPDMNIKTTSCCGPTNLWYSADVLKKAALSFAKAAATIKPTEGFNFDLVDTWRQVINLKGRIAYDSIIWSFKNTTINSENRKAVFNRNKKQFLDLLILQDKWVGTNTYFRVGRWLNQAKNMLPDAADKKMAEWNARMQITLWGPADPTSNYLHEYANKEWQGILKDLYFARWVQFFNYIEAGINGKTFKFPQFFDMEKSWIDAQNNYSEKPVGNQKLILKEIVALLK